MQYVILFMCANPKTMNALIWIWHSPLCTNQSEVTRNWGTYVTETQINNIVMYIINPKWHLLLLLIFVAHQGSEVCDAILRVIKKSSTIEELVLDNVSFGRYLISTLLQCVRLSTLYSHVHVSVWFCVNYL